MSRGYCSLQQEFFGAFFSLATIKSERTIHYTRFISTVRHSP